MPDIKLDTPEKRARLAKEMRMRRADLGVTSVKNAEAGSGISYVTWSRLENEHADAISYYHATQMEKFFGWRRNSVEQLADKGIEPLLNAEIANNTELEAALNQLTREIKFIHERLDGIEQVIKDL